MNKVEIVKLEKMPKSVEELNGIINEYNKDPFKMAALCVAVFCNYENNVEETIKMVNVIKGPEDLSNYDIQFLKDRLDKKGYVVRSYFNGTSVENDYTIPADLYEIEVSDNPYSYQDDGYVTLYLKSSGADSLRPIKLRKKDSTGEWFLWEHTFLSDIRIPKSMDSWS